MSFVEIGLGNGRIVLNRIGTNTGATCAAQIAAAVENLCATAKGNTAILNGGFKGGWTTRHYRRPCEELHAIQLELAQSTDLATEAAPCACVTARAERLRRDLSAILTTHSHWRP